MDENKHNIKNLKKTILTMISAFLILCCLSLMVFAIFLVNQAGPLDSKGLNSYNMTTVYFDRDDKEIQQLHGTENRIPVKLEQVSPQAIKAVLAIEDGRFYKHFGIDFYRVSVALWTNYKQGRIVQGASTITQQMVGLSKLDRREKTWERKIKEALLAFKVEREYSKDQILELYLNWVYFGSGAYGIEAAAQTFFGKNAFDLNVEEGALLAGLIQNPSPYSPRYNPQAALERRSLVLEAMAQNGSLETEEAQKLKDTPLNLISNTIKEEYRYSSFTDNVIEQALDNLGLKGEDTTALFSEGYRIYTTLDVRVQDKIEEVYARDENFPAGGKNEIIQSAMVVLDPHTGEIRGLIGGRDIKGKRGFNRATQAKRQPGSTFKPLVVFGPSLEMGFSPASVLEDYPRTYKVNGKDWDPQNYDGRYRGLVSMRTAAKYSINVWSVRMLNQIGIKKGIDFAERLGITTLVRQGNQNDLGLSLALGGLTKGVSPLELTAAYGTFANQGIYIKPSAIRRIEDREGKVVWENKQEEQRVMSEQTAYLLTSMLQTGVEEGTGKMARLADWPVAGKTGTTSDTKDAWFVGYTPRLVAAVWLGYDEPREMRNVIGGGRNAGPIWKQVMETAHETLNPEIFIKPVNIVELAVDGKSGLLPSPLTPSQFVTKEIFNVKYAPLKVSDRWIQVQICPVSHQLATSNCPDSVTKILFKRPKSLIGENQQGKFISAVTEDQFWAVPEGFCKLHDPMYIPEETMGELAVR